MQTLQTCICWFAVFSESTIKGAIGGNECTAQNKNKVKSISLYWKGILIAFEHICLKPKLFIDYELRMKEKGPIISFQYSLPSRSECFVPVFFL